MVSFGSLKAKFCSSAASKARSLKLKDGEGHGAAVISLDMRLVGPCMKTSI